jgi:hypothetical protein
MGMPRVFAAGNVRWHDDQMRLIGETPAAAPDIETGMNA